MCILVKGLCFFRNRFFVTDPVGHTDERGRELDPRQQNPCSQRDRVVPVTVSGRKLNNDNNKIFILTVSGVTEKFFIMLGPEKSFLLILVISRVILSLFSVLRP